jgi:hypothetical protein
MEDMTAFERLVAAEVRRQFGPARPVDTARIVRSAATSAPVGRWSVIWRGVGSSARPTWAVRRDLVLTTAKFGAAAAIVTLFAGYLLMSLAPARDEDGTVPAAPASPSPTPVVLRSTDVVTSMDRCEWTAYWPWPAAKCTVTASDPRVSGQRTSQRTGQAGIEPDGSDVIWGDTTLMGTEGAWRGRWFVVRYAGMNHWLAILSGEGAYDGLTYVYASDVSDDPLRPWSSAPSSGVIFAGPQRLETTASSEMPDGEETDQAATTPGPSGVPAVVTGTKGSCEGWGWGAITSAVSGRIPCREKMDDPRVSGRLADPTEGTCERGMVGGCVSAGGIRIIGTDGTWDGSQVRLMVDDHPRELRVATGTGAYAGWVYVSHADRDGVRGLIYQGPPPPWLSPGG